MLKKLSADSGLSEWKTLFSGLEKNDFLSAFKFACQYTLHIIYIT